MSSPSHGLPPEPKVDSGPTPTPVVNESTDGTALADGSSDKSFPSLAAYTGVHEGLTGVPFWPRAGARIIDLIVHYVVSWCAAFAFGIMLAIAVGGGPSATVVAKLRHNGIMGFLLALIGYASYHTICEGLHGSSVGKRMLSLVVIQEDGSPCRFPSAVIRSFAYFIDALFFGLIGYFAMQKTPQEQRLGDEWAHTIVCKRSQGAVENLRDGGTFLMALLLAVMCDAAFVLLSLLLKIMA